MSRWNIQKGVGLYTGDGWKDCTKKGEVVFTYGRELQRPYGEGQFERVGNRTWTASRSQFDFTPASLPEIIRLLPKIWADRKDRRLVSFRWEASK